MAVIPIKSVFGKLMGFTRPTTAYPQERLVVPGGFVGSAIYLSTTAGSETAVNIQGFTDVETSSTGTAALATRGVSLISSAASTAYTLAAPPAVGIRKTLFTVSTSTLVRQVTSASPIIVGNSSTNGVGSDGSVITGSTAMTLLSFAGIGQCIELISITTGAWINSSLRGYTSTVTVPISTV